MEAELKLKQLFDNLVFDKEDFSLKSEEIRKSVDMNGEENSTIRNN